MDEYRLYMHEPGDDADVCVEASCTRDVGAGSILAVSPEEAWEIACRRGFDGSPHPALDYYVEDVSPTKLYLAGPMSGHPQFNFPLFDIVAEALRDLGYEVVSPAELDDPATREAALRSVDGDPNGGTNGESWGDFLARDVKLIGDEVDGVAVMPEWWTSRGARLEAFTAQLSSKPVYLVHELLDGHEFKLSRRQIDWGTQGEWPYRREHVTDLDDLRRVVGAPPPWQMKLDAGARSLSKAIKAYFPEPISDDALWAHDPDDTISDDALVEDADYGQPGVIHPQLTVEQVREVFGLPALPTRPTLWGIPIKMDEAYDEIQAFRLSTGREPDCLTVVPGIDDARFDR